MWLHQKIVLITGGSRGVGKAIALRLAQEGPQHIFIGYCLNQEAARETVAEIETLGVSASAIKADVGRVELMEEIFETVNQRFGRLDIFVSNAARASFRPLEKLSLKSWQRTLDLNARAFLVGGKLAAQLMTEDGGRIVGLSSLGSRLCAPGYAALGAAKAAIETLSRYMAVELAPRNINVNVVCGGFVDTESMRLHPDYQQLSRQVLAATPAARLGKPEDLAGVVAFLCGPDATWVRGQTLIADGGYSLMS